MKVASNALTFAPIAVRNAPNVTTSSARPVICAVNVRERICGAKTVISAETAPRFAPTAERFALTVLTRYAPIAASAPVALTNSAQSAVFVLNAPRECAKNATGA